MAYKGPATATLPVPALWLLPWLSVMTLKWILFFPAVTLLAFALSINLFGDWLRDTLNPKLK